MTAYYVATDGDNADLGTKAEPWLTLQYGCDQLSAGDTLLVRGGSYNEVVAHTGDGTTTSRIAVRAYPGETPIVDGGGTLPADGSHLFKVRGDYCTLDGLSITDSNGGGFEMRGIYGLNNNCLAYANDGNGIRLEGNNSICNNGRAYLNGSVGLNISGVNDDTGNPTEGINCIIRNGIAYNNTAEGISTSRAQNSIIEDCVAYDNVAVELYVVDTDTALIQRNLVYETGDPTYDTVGIGIADEAAVERDNTDLTIINNLVVGCRRNLFWWLDEAGSGLINTIIAHNTFANASSLSNIRINASAGFHSNTQITNNIFLQEDATTIAVVPTEAEITWSYNLWSKIPEADAQGIGDIVDDPLLNKIGDITPGNLTFLWFALGADSPAIDASIDLGFLRDYRGTPVPQRGGSDMGAYEYRWDVFRRSLMRLRY